MSQVVELSDESVMLLKQQAAARGLSLDAWVQMLARMQTGAESREVASRKALVAAERIREIQSRVKPDPDGWTSRDYINHGRP